MQTMTFTPSPRPLPPPVVLFNRLLLSQTSSVTLLSDPGTLAPAMLAVRATQMTVVLRQILDDKGYFHGGINE